MTEELKPCPFCGGNPDVYSWNGGGVVWVRCRSCGIDYKAYANADEAIEAWNTRYERTCKMIPNGETDFAATLACSACGNVESVYAISSDEFNYCPNCGARVEGD